MRTMSGIHIVLALILTVLILPCFCAAQKTGDEESKLPAVAKELGIVVERNVPVPMRDGTILRADVHRPDRGGPYPVLVQRTPYGKSRNFDRFVKAGYIVVSQDARGRYESEGKYESMWRFETHDAEDGYDTVEWAAKLPGSTGKVGTFGTSYPAFLQWRLAPLQPPSLVAMSAFSIPAQLSYGEGYTLRPGFRLGWWASMALDMRRKDNLPGVQTAREHKILWQQEEEKWINWLAWLELPDDFYGHETQYLKNWLKTPYRDPWRLHDGCKNVTVPNLNVVGWYDHANGDMLLFRTMIKEAKTDVARRASRIIIGPWTHGSYRRRYGHIDFGPDAVLDSTLQIQWFDYWLKGKQNGVDKDPPVRIFVMGDNAWRDEQHWPLQRAKEKVLFATSNGHANTPNGDGKLLDKLPKTSSIDKYSYDPNNPVPTPTGVRRPIPSDQRPLADRQDILVYETEPLKDRIEVTGNPVVELYASSSAPDTDWFVRLIDVYPDGLALDVSHGLIRARYRNRMDKPELNRPGDVIKYTIRMRPTSNAFLPGHRIRLDITSSDFPNYDRNHNTAVDQNADTILVVAHQTIYNGGGQATRLILPWVPNPIVKEESTEKSETGPKPKRQMYPLHQAAADGDIEKVRLLISKGAVANAKDEEENTPLCSAVKSGKMEIVQLLVEAGADVNAGSWPPLCVAIDENDVAIADYLIAHGANPNTPVRWTALREAVYNNNSRMVELLLTHGANANVGPWNALHSATEEGLRDIVELLLENNADISWRNDEGQTALHCSAIGGTHKIAQLLLGKGAQVDGVDKVYGFTALHYAARFGNKGVGEVLIAHGADIQAKDKWGYQPIHWAAFHDRPEIIELLIAKGTDVDAKTSLGQSPVELAKPRRNTATVDVLRKYGAKE